ncbi:MAG: vanadium-dependent haloperoxidase [Verrucomicrobiaceae bacterium]|nr:vanadium-dependent haloperoxidase [Verrucomicrobiaceae bacterium]
MRPPPLRLLTVLLTCVVVCAGHVQAQQSAARVWNEELLAAIRRDVPNPPGHARNLFHTAVAMYDAWAAYDATAVGYLYNEKVTPLPGDIEAARHQAISYAAYRILKSRFPIPAFNGSNQTAIDNATTTNNSLNAQLTTLGYSIATAQAAITNGTTPAEVGKRIGQAVLTWGAQDGYSNTTYPQAYTAAINPNLNLPLPVLGTNLNFVNNMPLGFGIPSGTDPNLWQPLALSTGVTQNGIPIPGGTQTFVGVQSLATIPFSLTRADATKPWVDPFGGPSKLSRPGQPSSSDASYKDNFMDCLRKSAKLNDNTVIDISPGAIGNNPLGTDTGTGRATNPVTGLPYAANLVKRGDYARTLAEFWADGPNSETPPGHWHVLANEVSDDPLTVKKIRGTGPTVNDLEWDVKTYLSIAGAVHDAACAAWSLKRYYSGTRPITAIRHMGTKGQSSNPLLPHYDSEGLPLETNVVELITNASSSPGGKHELIWDVATGSFVPGSAFVDEIAVYSWPGEHPNNLPAPSVATNQSMVCWMLAKDWLPFQRKTFNTPAFPGYISGHSTFSRSAAEALTLLTGSANFPGGFHHHTTTANSLQIDLGPSANVDLQWTTYYDAADQAGISRRWGGIHPYEDDYHGRVIGAQVGVSAFNKAEKYWTGTIQSETIVPAVTLQANGDAIVTWPEVIGRLYRVQKSTNMTTWTDASKHLFAATTSGSFTDVAPAPGTFYKIIETTPSIARTWNEVLLNAIRIDTPHPPKHARNLFHVATAMYDAWSAYDTTAIGYIHHERATAGDVAAARKEAISYAAYRILKNRFPIPAFNGSNQQAIDNATTTNNRLDSQMAALGYDTGITTTSGTTPAALGNRIAADIIAWGLADGSNQSGGYQDPSYSNPQPAMIVLQSGLPRGYGVPFGTDPNLWQPLAFDAAFTQNGLQADLVQKYVGVTWLNTLPFAHTRASPSLPWIDPGPPSALYMGGGVPTPAEAVSDQEYKEGALYVLEASARLNDQTLIDMSPASLGNSPLGTDDGHGYTVNPYTGLPYASNFVKFGDYARVMAEFWADGPQSETPPGHWHVLANEVADNPLTVKKIGGTGPTVDDLEWDVKTYFAMSGATHDAACAVWSVKRFYQGVRPVTAIRYMGALGQSSNPALPSYNSKGLLLEDGVCELVTAASAAAGQRHEQVWDMSTNSYVPGLSLINTVVVYSWPGEPADPATQTSSVRWMRAIDWVPYQRETFNTPAFPGYISGHSGFSRAAAEIMTALTASPFFPGGIGTFTAEANHYLVFEQGPTATTQLQWATYYDAADLAGQSRRWGGIHVREDDYKSRIVGSQSGKQVWKLAQKFWNGSILTERMAPTQTFLPGGGVTITCPAQRGLYYHLERSSDLINWTPVTPDTRCDDTTISFTDPTSSSGARFYRIVFDAKSS